MKIMAVNLPGRSDVAAVIVLTAWIVQSLLAFGGLLLVGFAVRYVRFLYGASWIFASLTGIGLKEFWLRFIPILLQDGLLSLIFYGCLFRGLFCVNRNARIGLFLALPPVVTTFVTAGEVVLFSQAWIGNSLPAL